MIDPRGPRFAAGVTTVVLAVVLITGSTWLLGVQAVIFALGASLGPGASPYGLVFARFIRPRLRTPKEPEESAPPRFAQAVGLVFSLAGLAGYVTGVTVLAYVAVGAALAAAFLNAAFGFCLGCEIYLAYRRIVSVRINKTPEVNS
ncbi:DUF4395 domain-containing protein [Phytoactinopolyspora halophila]|nr:DUF4395 domain-containing protein [Phytoactinopolyspora halophila]